MRIRAHHVPRIRTDDGMTFKEAGGVFLLLLRITNIRLMAEGKACVYG